MTVEMKKYKLGELGEIRMCKRILKEETNTVSGVPFFKIGTFGNVADVFITRKKFEEYKAKYSYPKKGDVLISAAGTIGRTVVYNGEDAYFQDSNIVWIENDESKVVNALLYYAYKNVKWKVSNGSTILRLYNDDLRRTEIFVPADISVQKKIASVLSTLDKRIENLRAQNRILEQTAKTIYDYTFLQCAGHQTTYNKTLNRNIPTNWEVKNMSELAEVINGATPSTAEEGNFDGDIVWITPKDLSDQKSKFVYFGERTITQKGYDSCSTTLVPINSILMSSRAPIGLVSIAKCELCTNQGFKTFAPKSEDYTEYLYYYLLTNMKKIEQLGSGTTFKEVSRGSLTSFPVIVPDKKTLDAFNSSIKPLFEKQLVNTKQIEALTTQRNTLLPLLMTGQIEV